MDNKNIIFFGGSGLIGNSVLNILDKKESKIYAFSRQNLDNKFKNVKDVIFNFDTLEASIELNKWDHIYICLGRRLKVWELLYIKKKDRENHFKIEHDYIIQILKKAKKLGARDVSIISAIGANKKSSNFYLKTKGLLEESIKLLGYDNVSILRPGHILTNNNSSSKDFLIWIIDIFSRLSNFFLIGPMRKYRAIEIDKLSNFMVEKNNKGLNIYYYDDFITFK
jgi:dTDP-4-dehydrorhamnose reductase